MQKNRLVLALILFLFTFSVTQSAMAQKGLIVELEEKTFGQEVFYELYTDHDIWDNPDKRKEVFVATDPAKLEKAATDIGQPPEIEKMKMYVQGEMFRVDSETEEGKMTFILRNDLGMLYQIIWAKNVVIKMSKEEIEKMRQGAMNMANEMQKNMPPNMEKILESLPEPQRKKALEAMKAAGKGYPGMTTQKTKPTLKDMHKSKDFPGFPGCKEFNAVDGEKYIAMWAYGGKPEVAKMFHEFGDKFKNTMGMEDEDVDPAELLPKHLFPVYTATYSESMYGGSMDFKTSQLVNLEQVNIDIGTFEAYKDSKLKEGTMMDAMNLNSRKR